MNPLPIILFFPPANRRPIVPPLFSNSTENELPSGNYLCIRMQLLTHCMAISHAHVTWPCGETWSPTPCSLPVMKVSLMPLPNNQLLFFIPISRVSDSFCTGDVSLLSKKDKRASHMQVLTSRSPQGSMITLAIKHTGSMNSEEYTLEIYNGRS